MTPLEMQSLYYAGKSTNEIGAMIGKSGATICYHLHGIGTVMRDRTDAKMASLGLPGFWNAERLAVLKRWFGLRSDKAIGGMLGCSKSAVTGKANRLGLCRPSRRESKQPEPCMQFPFQHHSLIHFKEIPELQAMWERERGKIQEGSQAKWSLL